MSCSEGGHRIEIKGAIKLPESPYPGLRAFRLKEWPIFFGRERMVDDVIDRIGESRFIMVHGGSGSGKSSLVRAGVIAQLQREHAKRSLDWCPAIMMPGSSPMWHFATSVVGALTGQEVPDHGETAKTRLRLNRGADGVAEVLRELAFSSEQRLFILVDQFEELFRFADEEGSTREAADFVRLLVDLYNRCPENVYVALTMRSDHLGDCSRFAGLAEIVNATQYLVPPMDEVELEDAISRPAAIYKGSVDRDLALQLIRETRHSADQLPLVQHALSYMWDLEKARIPNQPPNLSVDCYNDRAVGSVTMALSNHADAILNELKVQNKGARNTAEGVFRALTQIDNAGRAIRRRRTHKELLDEVGGSEELLDMVIEAFAGKDLLVVEEVDPERDPKIDISHEALIRHWATLNDDRLDVNGQPRGWVAREASDGHIWQSLVATVESAKDSTEVYLPKAIYESRRLWWEWRNPTPVWAEEHGNQFQKIQGLFERSQKRIEEETQRKREEAQRKREADKAKERARKLAIGIAVIAVVAALGLGGLTRYTLKQSAQIEEQYSILDKQKTELDKSLIQIKDNNIILEQRKTELDKSNESLIRTKNDLQTALIIAKSNEKVAVQALEAQWRFTLDATKKSSRINESDVITNILIALEFLPDKSSTNDNRKYFPLIPNVEKALKDALAIVQAVLTGHEDEVDGVAYSPDGKLIATGSDDKTVRIWNAATGDLLQELLGHSNDVCRIAFSPDGNRIVSGSMDGTARIWDVKAGKELHQLKDGSKDRIWGVAWSLDGSHVATGHSRNIRIWNTETGSSPAQLVGHSDSVWDVVFSPDGSRLLSVSSDRTARIWDVNTGTMQLQFNEHDNAVYGASWSSDGKLVATGSADNTVRIWEADTGNQCFSFLHEATVYGVAFSPNGKWLSTGCEDNSARIWDVKTGELKQTLSGHRKGVDAVTWSPDGRLLVTGSDDNTVGVFAFDNTVTRNTASVKMQDLVDRAKKLVPRCFSEEDRAQLGLVNEIPQWCRKMEKPPFDAKGRLERGIWMLTQDPPDFEKAEKLFKEAEKLDSSLADQIQARKVGALREGASKLLAQRVNSIDLVDSKLKTAQEFVKRGIESDLGFTDNFETVKLKFLIDSGQSILLSGRKNDAQQAFRRALSLDPTKRHAVIVARIEAAQKLGQTDIALLLTLELDQDSEDTKRLLSEILRGEATKMLLKGHKEMIFGVAYSPDGKLIGTGSNDKTVRIWDAVTGELRQELRGHSMSVRRIAFSPDSTRIVSGSSDGTARIWDIKNGEELHRLEHQSEDRIWGVAWSGDGIHIASGSLENHHIDIWEAEGSHLKRLVGHSDGVYDVVFSPDGSLLLSVSTDFTSRIWDVNDGTELLLFKQHKDRVYGASWSSDGKLVATGSADNTVRIWEAGTGNQRFVLTHNGYITGISFSPDGRWLATGSQDNSTRIWDTDTGKLKQTLSRSVSRSEGSRLEGTVYAVAWSPDGRLIVTGSGDSTVRIYDTSDLDNVDQSLFDRALSKVTRRLTKEEREEFNLPPEIPEWYNRILRIYTK